MQNNSLFQLRPRMNLMRLKRNWSSISESHWRGHAHCCRVWCIWVHNICHSQPSWKTSCVHVKDSPRQRTTLPSSRERGYSYHRSCPTVVTLHITPRVSPDHRPRSVAIMLDKRKSIKIKNNTIQGWWLELASYSYTIQYRTKHHICYRHEVSQQNVCTLLYTQLCPLWPWVFIFVSGNKRLLLPKRHRHKQNLPISPYWKWTMWKL